MKRILLSLCLAVGLPVTMMAQTSQVVTVNGTTLTGKVVKTITFSGSDATLVFSDNSSETYDMGLVTIAFDYTTGINTIETFNVDGTIDGEMNVSGVDAGSAVMVFDLSGKQVVATRASKDGNANVDATGLKSGVYIMKAGNKSIKFIKK